VASFCFTSVLNIVAHERVVVIMLVQVVGVSENILCRQKENNSIVAKVQDFVPKLEIRF
jgi:hypothetical protein